MDKEKITEVGNLLDIDASEVEVSKVRKFFKALIFPVIQLGFFLSSSFLGFAFGHWENENPSTYPYGFIPRASTLGIFTLVSINSGNLVLSLKTRKRSGIATMQVVLTVFGNLALSLISFFFLYNIIETYSDPSCYSISVRYDVYAKKKN